MVNMVNSMKFYKTAPRAPVEKILDSRELQAGDRSPAAADKGRRRGRGGNAKLQIFNCKFAIALLAFLCGQSVFAQVTNVIQLPASSAPTSFDPPYLIAAFLACLAFALMVFNQGGKAVDRFRGKQPHPPNEVLSANAQAVIERLDRLERGETKVWTKMEQDRVECARQLAEVNKTNEERAVALHNRVNDILSAVSGLSGKIEQMNQRSHR